MQLFLYDCRGDLTALGSALRIVALVAAIASGLALVPAAIFGLLSGMLCDAGCPSAVGIAVKLMVLSPLLLLTSAVAGVVAFRGPNWGLILLTLAPVAVVAVAFAIGFG